MGSSAFPFNALTVSYFSQSPTCTFIFQKYLCILLSRVFVVAARALLAVAVVPWPGIEPRSPAWGARSLNHWTPREVPPMCTFKVYLKSATFVQGLPLGTLLQNCYGDTSWCSWMQLQKWHLKIKIAARFKPALPDSYGEETLAFPFSRGSSQKWSEVKWKSRRHVWLFVAP